MRTNSLLDELMPQIRQKILAATLLHPEKSWYLRELAQFLGLSPSSIQRELSGLSKAGILEKSVGGNRTYFKASEKCPIFPELKQVLTKTIGVADIFREHLKPLSKRISVAFVYGSIASGTESSDSDVDLLVVGEVGLADIAKAIKMSEQQLRRAVNPVILSPKEARQKLKEKHYFIDKVRRDKKLFIVGEEHELGKAFSR